MSLRILPTLPELVYISGKVARRRRTAFRESCMRSSDGCEFLPGAGRSSGRKTSPFSLDFDSLGALGGQNFTSQIVPLGFRRWTPLTRLCDQKHGSRAPWGPSEISKIGAKLPPPYPRPPRAEVERTNRSSGASTSGSYPEPPAVVSAPAPYRADVQNGASVTLSTSYARRVRSARRRKQNRENRAPTTNATACAACTWRIPGIGKTDGEDTSLGTRGPGDAAGDVVASVTQHRRGGSAANRK